MLTHLFLSYKLAINTDPINLFYITNLLDSLGYTRNLVSVIPHDTDKIVRVDFRASIDEPLQSYIFMINDCLDWGQYPNCTFVVLSNRTVKSVII